MRDPPWLRLLCIGVALSFLGILVVVPLAAVFAQAFQGGVGRYLHALGSVGLHQAIALTLLVAAIAVPLNVSFGLSAAWLVTRFRFRGKGLLLALIDIPFAVSPVISGLIFVLLFGRNTFFGHFLSAHGIRVLFAVPGLVLATTFVTFPFVARELIPLLQSQGVAEEEVALTLGASGFQMFSRVTLPKIRWALLYGIVICNARAMGEFGAVSVVSGHIRGRTTTVPLYVEMLYNEYDFIGAFAAASVLTALALFTLLLKKLLARKLPNHLPSVIAQKASRGAA
ncbi:MAG: sulfate ABC transporter permease subunit CysW [Polyangiales bacterium]